MEDTRHDNRLKLTRGGLGGAGLLNSSQVRASRGMEGTVAPRHKRITLEARPRPNPGEQYQLEGATLFSIVIDAQGKVADLRLVKGAATPPWPRYEASLAKAVRKIRFKPGTLGDKPTRQRQRAKPPQAREVRR